MFGWDPIAFGNLEGVEALWGTEVLQAAEDLWQDHRKALIKAIEVAVQRGVASAFKKT